MKDTFFWGGEMWSDETPHRTTLDPKILQDGIDQTPQCTGDLDTLSQRGYGPTTQLWSFPPRYSQGV